MAVRWILDGVKVKLMHIELQIYLVCNLKRFFNESLKDYIKNL